ncbi:membrane protein insertion efficiency factor YidD [Effusibacillus consociatus]|uniref:Putative membrane protein insertion efficiency factor n=1 Tax=Effusibacillus consociatus TaxID=1117041 RepID=A0ABV9Q754_9BACL
MKRLALLAIQFYRKWISPMKPPSCRFYPTCSAYALEAIDKHGITRGGWLSAKRLIKCAPWHPGGYDPVPEVKNRGLQ